MVSQIWNIFLGVTEWSVVQEQACSISQLFLQHCDTMDISLRWCPSRATSSCWKGLLGWSCPLRQRNQPAYRRCHSPWTGRVGLCVGLNDSFATLAVSRVPTNVLDQM